MKELNGQEAYEQLQKLLGDKKNSLRVMERQVDIEIQMAYFEKSKEIKSKLPDLDVALIDSEALFDEDAHIETKRKVLNMLAAFEDVKCFRILEKYQENPDKALNDWSYLAYQESLMKMESSLSDEERVYISSGLGGRGDMLRYFVVMLSNDFVREFKPNEQELIVNELKYQFKRQNAELEEYNFYSSYLMFTCLISINVGISDLFNETVKQVNEFGSVLHDSFLITNVKKMTVEEVEELVNKKIAETESDLE